MANLLGLENSAALARSYIFFQDNLFDFFFRGLVAFLLLPRII
jgi:hypothetical protein